MRSHHCTRRSGWALGASATLAAVLSTTALVVVLGAQSAPETASSSTFTIYLRSAPIGSETISVARTPDGWTISSSGRTGLPIDLATRQLQLHYTPDWKPIDLSIDATIRGVQLSGRTTVSGTTAQSSFLQNGETVNRTDTIAPDAVLLINPLWAPFEALARRVRNAPPGTTVPGHVLGTAFSIEVGPSKDETLQMGTQTFSARRTAVTLPSGGAMLQAEIWSDDAGRLLRVSIPAQNLEVVREDIASVAVRVVKVSRPNDEDIRIPANGFRLAATLSKPMNAAPKDKLPLVVLVGGSGPTDRDETVYGIPIFGQLAGALADAGFMVVRYDKRAVGQSGGRAESATLNDYADDLIAVLTAVGKRDDVDDDRVAVLGHSEGGSVAMISASREGDIKALALVATMGTTGAELNMWQVMHAMERSKQPPEETATTIELQRRIQEAVITGKGWDRIPAQYRQADIPWFKSFLTFDPAALMKKIPQPILIVQGALDKQVPPENADRLEAMAKARNKSTVDTVKIPGINHLLVEASTGEVDEYGALPSRTINPLVGQKVAEWLTRTFAAAR